MSGKKYLNKLVDNGCYLSVGYVRYGEGYFATLQYRNDQFEHIENALTGGDQENAWLTSMFHAFPWFPQATGDTIDEALDNLDKVLAKYTGEIDYWWAVGQAVEFVEKDQCSMFDVSHWCGRRLETVAAFSEWYRSFEPFQIGQRVRCKIDMEDDQRDQGCGVQILARKGEEVIIRRFGFTGFIHVSHENITDRSFSVKPHEIELVE